VRHAGRPCKLLTITRGINEGMSASLEEEEKGFEPLVGCPTADFKTGVTSCTANHRRQERDGFFPVWP
jgi:hypothetical protein